MAYKDCIADIFNAAGGALTKSDIEEFLPEIEQRFAKRQRLHPMESPQESASAVGLELSQEAKTAAIIEARNLKINMMRREGIRAAIGPQKDKMTALDTLTTGAATGQAGRSSIAGRGVQQRSIQRHQSLAAPMFGKLERKGYAQLINRSQDFMRQVYHEVWRLSDPDNPHLLAKGGKEATEVGEIIGRTVEAGRLMQNRAGAYIGKMPGYVTRNDWDMMKVRKMGPQGFADFIRNHVDMEKSFDDPTNAEAVNKTINGWYASLSTGVHDSLSGADDWLTGFKGPGNLGKRVSRHREIHWKGPDDAIAAQRTFGTGSFLEAVDRGLERAGRNTALMEIFGTNPQAMFDNTLKWISETARDTGDTKTVDNAAAFRKSRDKFSVATGDAWRGGNPTGAAVIANIQGWQTLAHLGSTLASAVTDLPLTAGTLRQSGIGYFDGAMRQVFTVLEGRTGPEKREILEQLHVMLDGTLGDFGARFAAPDGPRGWMAKTVRTFFKYNGLTWWTDRMRTGVGLALSNNLGKFTGSSFEQLPDLLKRNLNRYDITARDWDLIRKIELQTARGTSYLTADGAKYIPDDDIKAWLGKDAKDWEIEEVRDAITSKLGTYFTDQVDEAINNPGLYERWVTTGAQPAGTIKGAAIRAFMQFKTFGVSVTRRHFGRELYRGEHVDKTGLALLILGTTTMGYVAMQTKLLLSGKYRDPRDIEGTTDALATVGAAFVQGGGAGIYGDFLFGNYNRFGQGAIETLGGPSVGTFSDVLRLGSMLTSKKTMESVGEGEAPKDVKAKALQMLKSNLPFQNFIWTKAATDYLIFQQMQEAMNPGYLRRMERRTEKDQGITFWLRPS